MIVRTTNDPAAWRDLGPWRPEAYIPEEAAGVDSRHIDPASIPPSPAVGRRIAGILSTREAERAAARRRGSEATRKRTSHARVPDDVLIATLRATGGNSTRAAQMIGVTRQAVTQRIVTLDRLALLPDDVWELVEARRREA